MRAQRDLTLCVFVGALLLPGWMGAGRDTAEWFAAILFSSPVSALFGESFFFYGMSDAVNNGRTDDELILIQSFSFSFFYSSYYFHYHFLLLLLLLLLLFVSAVTRHGISNSRSRTRPYETTYSIPPTPPTSPLVSLFSDGMGRYRLMPLSSCVEWSSLDLAATALFDPFPPFALSCAVSVHKIDGRTNNLHSHSLGTDLLV